MRQLTTKTGRSVPRDRRGHSPRSRESGVTLVELIVVMVIVVILMAIGVPSYKYVTTSNRMATEIDSLLGDLQYARSEAVREGQYVTVCIAQSTSAANPSCAATGTTTWQDGWIVFSDLNHDGTIDSGDPVLRIQNALSSSDTLIAGGSTSEITFNRDGFAYLGAATTSIALNDAGNDTSYARCLDISQAGMMTTTTNSSDSSCQ